MKQGILVVLETLPSYGLLDHQQHMKLQRELKKVLLQQVSYLKQINSIQSLKKVHDRYLNCMYVYVAMNVFGDFT